ncbi:hypothetical protein GQR58_011602 [Nymphon striatum]|nr:hypothetical protein GQR58_011602 [Nymphon striatum]
MPTAVEMSVQAPAATLQEPLESSDIPSNLKTLLQKYWDAVDADHLLNVDNLRVGYMMLLHIDVPTRKAYASTLRKVLDIAAKNGIVNINSAALKSTIVSKVNNIYSCNKRFTRKYKNIILICDQTLKISARNVLQPPETMPLPVTPPVPVIPPIPVQATPPLPATHPAHLTRTHIFETPKSVKRSSSCYDPPCGCKTDISSLNAKIKELEQKVRELEIANDILNAALAETQVEATGSKNVASKLDNKTYSISYRKAAYLCLFSQVPVETVSEVMNSVVKELTNGQLDCNSDKSTVIQFSYELGVLSDIQGAQLMIDNDNLTLAWDATSLDANHINEVHVYTPGKPPKGHVLQISSLPGGTTDDYNEHLTNSNRDFVDSYSLLNKTDYLETLKTVQSQLKNNLSDRVAVNHCVVEKLKSTMDIELLELKCNVHPLDGMASNGNGFMVPSAPRHGFEVQIQVERHEIYGNKNNLSNLETSPMMRTCLAKLKHMKDNPMELLICDNDVFEHPLNSEEDRVIDSLQKSNMTDQQKRDFPASPHDEDSCQTQLEPVDDAEARVSRKCKKGTLIVLEGVCKSNENHRRVWQNQPSHRKIPTGNLLLAGAILLSGSNPVRALNMLKCLKIETFSLRTYYRIQKGYLLPAIHKVWSVEQHELMAKVTEPLKLGGDARCCSPGHTAKYGSSIMTSTLELQSFFVTGIDQKPTEDAFARTDTFSGLLELILKLKSCGDLFIQGITLQTVGDIEDISNEVNIFKEQKIPINMLPHMFVGT